MLWGLSNQNHTGISWVSTLRRSLKHKLTSRIIKDRVPRVAQREPPRRHCHRHPCCFHHRSRFWFWHENMHTKVRLSSRWSNFNAKLWLLAPQALRGSFHAMMPRRKRELRAQLQWEKKEFYRSFNHTYQILGYMGGQNRQGNWPLLSWLSKKHSKCRISKRNFLGWWHFDRRVFDRESILRSFKAA